MRRWAACGALLLAAGAQAQDAVFAPGQLEGWRLETFENLPVHTEYREVADPASPAGRAIEAVADGGVAGYVREEELPFTPAAAVEISYQVLEARNPADERSKAGDDFPLRFYLTAKTGLFRYDTLVLVHALQAAAGDGWANPYSGAIARFEMHAVAGAGDELGEWRTLTVPVGRLWAERFGEVPDELVALGLMVDSDNAGGFMRTRIGEVSYRAR
ncbi:MAG: DUF3047 domain-containing protein [Betaproteobacteria bacterium AqS2]|uniref:DUF3047 domain-containing protein n=1 Tax=Candidatus Amphirhobacter heronislandensis TaxID=1732024 RepID=A0A930XY66_9GAMM|nr:DUF3047 domain-containing protein [Betaproteobacteria bacterium AqS2]